MWTGMMLLGLLAAFTMPDLSGGDDEDEQESDDAGGFDEDGADPLAGLTENDTPEFETGSFVAGGAPGVTVLLDFQAGSDELELRMPGDVSEVSLRDAGDEGPTAISYVSADEVTEVQFAGLETVPVDDISVTLDGADPIALGDFLSEAEAEDGADPTEPADAGDADKGIGPDDGEAPTVPSDSGDGDPGLPPDDGATPTELVLAPDDGEAPTVPDDSGDGDVGLIPDDGEAPTIPDDSGDGDSGLQPEDGSLPTVTTLAPDDGAAPTVPDDSGDGDVGLLPDDGSAPTAVGQAAPLADVADENTIGVEAGETVSGTEDEDVFWFDPDSEDPARIENFEPGEDVLYITLEPGTGGDVSMQPSEDGAGTLVQIGGQTVAVLSGTTEASLEDVYVDQRILLSA